MGRMQWMPRVRHLTTTLTIHTPCAAHSARFAHSAHAAHAALAITTAITAAIPFTYAAITADITHSSLALAIRFAVAVASILVVPVNSPNYSARFAHAAAACSTQNTPITSPTHSSHATTPFAKLSSSTSALASVHVTALTSTRVSPIVQFHGANPRRGLGHASGDRPLLKRLGAAGHRHHHRRGHCYHHPAHDAVHVLLLHGYRLPAHLQSIAR